MPKKTPLLPLTFEALKPAVEASAGKATRWTADWSDIVHHADEIENLRTALKLPKKDCIGIEGIFLTDTPKASAYSQKSRAVIGSRVTYRYTRDGWKVVSIEREERPCGQSASVRLVVPEAMIPEIQRRAVAHLIIRKAA